jgi:hypothetical protein
MSVNFSTMVKLPCQDMFSVPITVTPGASQPGQPAYAARGIFITGPVDVALTDGSIYADQQTILDVRDNEFGTVPMQGDIINIPFDCNGAALGDFEVTKADKDGGGLTTLSLRALFVALP